MKLLQYGDSGPYVEYLQLALNRADYDAGNIDGIFGWRTQNALTRFQRTNGLAADGIAGRLTWTRLYPYLSGYRIHVIRNGDTYSSISERYGTTIAALQTANPNVSSDNLIVGTELVVPLPFTIVSGSVRYSYAYVTIALDGLTARYPFLKQETVGRSVMGRRIEVIRMGEGEREVFYNASHHANEWITTPILLRFLEEYASAYVSDTQVFGTNARKLYDSVSLYMIPLVNPDGVDLVTGATSSDEREYQQAEALSNFYPEIPFPSGWKANIVGTDLNLGYPAGWQEARRIKFAQGYSRPGPRDYVGTMPLAEPENRAIVSFTQSHSFALTLSYHTQGEVIFWKYLDYEVTGSYEIAKAFSDASGYTVEDTPYASGFAGYKDWFIQQYGRPAYTIEAGKGENPLPISDFSEIYRENEGILTLGMVLSENI